MDNKTAATFETLAETFLRIVRINLTTETVDIIKNDVDDFCSSCLCEKKSTKCLHCFANTNNIHPSDKENYLKLTNIDYLRSFFKEKSEPWRFRYRRKSGNEFVWVMMEIVKARDYSDDDQNVLLFVQNVDKDLSNIFENEQNILNSLKTERMCMAIIHDLISSGIWRIIYDENGRESVFWSPEFRRMLGFETEEEFPNTLEAWESRLHPLDAERAKKAFYGTLNDKTGKKIYDIEYRLLTKNKGYRWFRDAGEVSRRPDGSPFIYLGIFIDITETKEKELLDNEIKRKNQIEQRQLNLIKSLSSIYFTLHVIDLETDAVTEFASNEYIRQYVNSSENASLQIEIAMQNSVDPRYVPKAIEFTNLLDIKERLGDKNTISEEFVGIHIGWFEASFIVAERDSGGEIASVIFATRSIDKEKRREENLLLLSNTDELTGLFNRHAYDTDSKKYTELPADLVVISMDLNGLKRVNDELGHAAGDEMLKASAECIKRYFSKMGKCYRMGGDEFMVIANVEPAALDDVYRDFTEDLASFRSGKIGELSISFGCAFVCDYPHLSLDELSKVADKKMYQDKNAYYIKSGKDRRRR